MINSRNYRGFTQYHILFFKKTKCGTGFTLLEVIIVLCIITIISSVTLVSLSGVGSKQSLDKSGLLVMSLLEQARSETLASKNSSEYGVHFDANQVVLFKGTVYSAGDSSNIILPLDSKVTLSNITLQGGGSEAVFQRLTGSAYNPGTLRISLISNSSVYKTITINSTGIIDIN